MEYETNWLGKKKIPQWLRHTSRVSTRQQVSRQQAFYVNVPYTLMMEG